MNYKLSEAAAASRVKEQELWKSYKRELDSKDEVIAYYKDLKTRLSTKMVGETLEQHCETEFNRLRAAAFPQAYFEKIMIYAPAARATISTANSPLMALSFFLSCLR